jgi:hypothetical protein
VDALRSCLFYFDSYLIFFLFLPSSFRSWCLLDSSPRLRTRPPRLLARASDRVTRYSVGSDRIFPSVGCFRFPFPFSAAPSSCAADAWRRCEFAFPFFPAGPGRVSDSGSPAAAPFPPAGAPGVRCSPRTRRWFPLAPPPHRCLWAPLWVRVFLPSPIKASRKQAREESHTRRKGQHMHINTETFLFFKRWLKSYVQLSFVCVGSFA